jgi:hypothetical protein
LDWLDNIKKAKKRQTAGFVRRTKLYSDSKAANSVQLLLALLARKSRLPFVRPALR